MAKVITGLLVAGLVSLYYAVSWGKDNQLDRSARGSSLAMAVGLLSLAAYFIFKGVEHRQVHTCVRTMPPPHATADSQLLQACRIDNSLSMAYRFSISSSMPLANASPITKGNGALPM